jgi:hypothetical protein
VVWDAQISKVFHDLHRRHANATPVSKTTIEIHADGLVIPSEEARQLPRDAELVWMRLPGFLQDLVGVRQESLNQHGAVSAEVAREMAEGARDRAGVSLALSCTGIAGPGGATPGKPVGLVFIGCAREGTSTMVERHVFPGDRAAVRAATVAAALDLAARSIKGG